MAASSRADYNIYNRIKVAEFLRRAATERVFLPLLSDSNHNFNSVGWTQGLGQALARAFGVWGTGALYAANIPAGDMYGGAAQAAYAPYLLNIFTASAAAATDILTFLDGTDLTAGDEVACPVTQAGITANAVYFVSRPAVNQIKLHTTLADALAGSNPVDITADVAVLGLRRVHLGRTTESDLAIGGMYIASVPVASTDLAGLRVGKGNGIRADTRR